jgi:hypothetical protein
MLCYKQLSKEHKNLLENLNEVERKIMKKSNEKILKSKFEKKYLGAVGTIEDIRKIILNDSITKKLVGDKENCIAAGVFPQSDIIHLVRTLEKDNATAKRIIIRYDIIISSYGDEGIPCAGCRDCQIFLLSRVVITNIEFMNMN